MAATCASYAIQKFICTPFFFFNVLWESFALPSKSTNIFLNFDGWKSLSLFLKMDKVVHDISKIMYFYDIKQYFWKTTLDAAIDRRLENFFPVSFPAINRKNIQGNDCRYAR